mmetsp:Transcript_8003/g.49435  ORF Transcript_8003/g.49435 Transcript_8003/m.49435 type:complete len:97 (-) Transcript_8003:961-1251(-)
MLRRKKSKTYERSKNTTGNEAPSQLHTLLEREKVCEHRSHQIQLVQKDRSAPVFEVVPWNVCREARMTQTVSAARMSGTARGGIYVKRTASGEYQE